MLGRVNKQNFKVKLKNIFLFFLTVLFCCDVGISVIDIEAGGFPSWEITKAGITHSMALAKR